MAQVRFITGNKILRIMKKLGHGTDLPEDLYGLIKKAVNIRKHLERSRKVSCRIKVNGERVLFIIYHDGNYNMLRTSSINF